MFDDRKTESRSARALAAPLINAEKAFKNAVKLILRYAYARVLNGNCGPSLAAETVTETFPFRLLYRIALSHKL